MSTRTHWLEALVDGFIIMLITLLGIVGILAVCLLFIYLASLLRLAS